MMGSIRGTWNRRKRRGVSNVFGEDEPEGGDNPEKGTTTTTTTTSNSKKGSFKLRTSGDKIKTTDVITHHNKPDAPFPGTFSIVYLLIFFIAYLFFFL